MILHPNQKIQLPNHHSRKMVDLETAQSKLRLLFPSSSTENVTKTSPRIISPLYSLPNNCRNNDPNLFGDKNRGEDVSDYIRKNTHGKFGVKNSDGKDCTNSMDCYEQMKIKVSTQW